tara:strand:+ start:508 stop:654 length:147 start_codon:yes stop_codon:yes gene_type:complete
MATRKTKELKTKSEMKRHMKTSIGNSINTSPKSKHKKRDWKAYRGQGK